MVDRPRSRRAYLAALGSLGASSLAGCSSVEAVVDTQLKKFDDRVQWSTKVHEPIDLHLADGTLYVYTRDAIYALNAQSGNQIWETSLPKDDPDRACYYAPFTVTEDRIYLSGCKGMFAYSTDDGSQLWRRDDLDLFKRTLLIDGLLYCQTGHTLNVIDPESGSTNRNHTLSDGPNTGLYGPTYRPADEMFYYVVDTAVRGDPDLVRAVDPSTGEVEWDLEIPFSRTQTRPVVGDDFLYVVSGDARVDRIEENRLFAVDPELQELTWTAQSRAALDPPVVGRDHVFVASYGTDEAFLTAVDSREGTAAWSHRVTDRDGRLSRPRVGQSRVTVAIGGRQIHTRTIADGTEAESFQLPMVQNVQPVQDGERLYVAAGTNVWALDR